MRLRDALHFGEKPAFAVVAAVFRILPQDGVGQDVAFDEFRRDAEFRRQLHRGRGFLGRVERRGENDREQGEAIPGIDLGKDGQEQGAVDAAGKCRADAVRAQFIQDTPEFIQFAFHRWPSRFPRHRGRDRRTAPRMRPPVL